MGTIHTGKAIASYMEPKARQIAGCHDCARIYMEPSLSGPRQPYCGRLGCWVKEMAICGHYQAKPVETA